MPAAPGRYPGERVLAGDDIRLVSRRWGWSVAVPLRSQGTSEGVVAWRIIDFARYSGGSNAGGSNAAVSDAEPEVL